MQQTAKVILRTVLLSFVLFPVAQCLHAQDARQQAWTFLTLGSLTRTWVNTRSQYEFSD